MAAEDPIAPCLRLRLEAFVRESAPHARKADSLTTETYDEQLERQWLESAARITEKQLRTALDVCTRVLSQDARLSEGTLVSGVLQALAMNMQTVRSKR